MTIIHLDIPSIIVDKDSEEGRAQLEKEQSKSNKMSQISRFKNLLDIYLNLLFFHTDMVCLRQATVKVEQDEDVTEEAKKKRRVE